MFKESKDRANGKTEQLKISIKKEKPYLALKTMKPRLVYPVDTNCTNKVILAISGL